MINKSEAIKIFRTFKDEVLTSETWYQQIRPKIKAELLYGSVAKGTNREDSDIDILIILPLASEEKYTAGEYFYDYKGYKINIVLRSVERLRQISKEMDELQREVFRDSIIIWSQDEEIYNLLKQIA